MYKDIDEAIKHAREVAEEQRVKNRVCGNCKYCVKGQIHPRQGYCYFNVIHYEHDLTQKACSNWESNDDIGCDCAEEHEQLAEWLEELKELRKFKEDFKDLGKLYSEIKADAIDDAIHYLDNTKAFCHEDYIDGIDFSIGVLENIAEQLKESKE